MTDMELNTMFREMAEEAYRDDLKGLEYSPESFNMTELARFTGHEYTEKETDMLTRAFEWLLKFNQRGQIEGAQHEN